MILRKAKREDLGRVIAIESLAGTSHWSLAQFSEEIDNDRAHFLVLEIDGQLEGYAVGWEVAGECHILEICVSPDQQRQGRGTHLLKGLVEACGGGISLLEVRESNAAARALYASYGFREEGRRSRYYPDGEDAILMRREPASQEPKV